MRAARPVRFALVPHRKLMIQLGDRMKRPDDFVEKLLGVPYESLDELTKKVTRHITKEKRKHIARNTAKEFDAKTTLGQRAADAVATFGGSWTFISIFIAILLVWVGLNSFILVKYDKILIPTLIFYSISFYQCWPPFRRP